MTASRCSLNVLPRHPPAAYIVGSWLTAVPLVAVAWALGFFGDQALALPAAVFAIGVGSSAAGFFVWHWWTCPAHGRGR